jgi:hypothetical protein
MSAPDTCPAEITYKFPPFITNNIVKILFGSVGVWALLLYVLYQRLDCGIEDIPGPFWASLTDFWRLLHVWRGRFDLTNQALHDKYGDLVRIGPNTVSVGDPREAKHIYGIGRLFQKV